MTRQIEILTRYRDGWNAAADRYLADAEQAEARNPEEAAVYRRLAVDHRQMAWGAHMELCALLGNTRKEAA